MEIRSIQSVKMWVVSDTTCDKCGMGCVGETCKNVCGVRVVVSGSYDSTIFPDDSNARVFHFCECCIDEWFCGFSSAFGTT